MIIIYIIYIFRNNKQIKSNIIKELIPVILILLLIIFFNPVSRHRANIAFTQHYAMGIQQRDNNRNGKLGEPEEIMRKDFSTDYSISKALTNNPQLFLEHVWFNFLRLGEIIEDTFPFFIIKGEHKLLSKIFYLTFLMLSAFFCYSLIVRIRKKKSGILTLIYFLYVLPPVISVFIFYPRVHYLIFLFAFVLIYLSYEISKRINSYEIMRKYYFPAAVVIGVFLIIVVPFRADTESIHESHCTELNAINSINKYKFNGKINFLAAGPGIVTYLENDWNIIKDGNIESPLQNFIKKNDINLILVDDFFLNHPSVIDEAELEMILNDTNFVKLNIPNCTSYLLARKNIMK